MKTQNIGTLLICCESRTKLVQAYDVAPVIPGTEYLQILPGPYPNLTNSDTFTVEKNQCSYLIIPIINNIKYLAHTLVV